MTIYITKAPWHRKWWKVHCQLTGERLHLMHWRVCFRLFSTPLQVVWPVIRYNVCDSGHKMPVNFPPRLFSCRTPYTSSKTHLKIDISANLRIAVRHDQAQSNVSFRRKNFAEMLKTFDRGKESKESHTEKISRTCVLNSKSLCSVQYWMPIKSPYLFTEFLHVIAFLRQHHNTSQMYRYLDTA